MDSVREQLLAGLNEEQRAAVTAPPQSALVIAGAGSGKTRVLTHRIAWLCHSEDISPYAVVAVTFTNKAAQEMRRRVEDLTEGSARSMWIGTFHGICNRILRRHYEAAELPQSFQILDAQDQLRIIKRITKALGLDEKKWPPKQTQYLINDYKELGKRAAAVQEENPAHARLLRIYAEYEAHCRRSGLADFTELLLRTVELLRDNEEVLEQYQHRFRHILVDEFQDTNTLQYAWIRLLAGRDIPVFVVGDDDQSIYGWRGACARNIRDFGKDFANAGVYRLQRNYRSNGNILKAANALIENNRDRMGKNLWTKAEDGPPIKVFAAYNEGDEAEFVVAQAAHWIDEAGHRRAEVAVLYRSNAQSRVIEQALIKKSIPYRVYGGMRFFERAVIKHAMAHMRLFCHRADDPSFERIVNFPPRGIGERTLEAVRERARADDCGLWNAAVRLIKEDELTPRSASSLSEFCLMVEHLADGIAPEHMLSELAARIAKRLAAHYEKSYAKNSDEAAISNMENLEEFIAAAREFESSFEAEKEQMAEDEREENIMDAFLTHAALEASETQGGYEEDCVQLMTLHSAKGLEFPLVIIVGLEENLFPHARSMATAEDLEEERRLCYVGITRARERLVMTYAEERNRGYGTPVFADMSRFLQELPAELLEEVRPRIQIKRPSRERASSDPAQTRFAPDLGINIGQAVRHSAFGDGVVLNLEGAGEHGRALVRFRSEGEKWLVLAYAKLELIA